jgi:uncharacterized Fe-S cluster-containing radical SAM superfamily protein
MPGDVWDEGTFGSTAPAWEIDPMPELSKNELAELLRESGHTCAICRRSTRVFPGIKLVPDTRVAQETNQTLTRVLCSRCKKGVDTFNEPNLMFRAILYLRGGV